jgi:hypothetical protein
MAWESYAELVVTKPFPLVLPWERAVLTWQMVEPSCQACQGEMVSADPPTCRLQRQRIGGVGWGGGLLAELASVFRPEAQVGPGGTMDSLGH